MIPLLSLCFRILVYHRLTGKKTLIISGRFKIEIGLKLALAMRVVFMGTPDFAVPTLERLIQSEHQIIGVYTQLDKPAGRGQTIASSAVKKVALAHGLPIFQPDSLRKPEVVESLANSRPELIVVAAFGQLLPQRVLDIPPFGCLNVHPSLLPRFRGPSPVAAAILAGDEVTGVSIMLMDKGMDTGPILAQTQTPILPQDTTGTLTDRLAQLGAQLLMETLPGWLVGCLPPKAQEEERAVYSKLIAKEESEVNWYLPALDLWRRVRVFQPFPGCYTRFRGKRLKIIEAAPLPGEKGKEPGRVIAAEEARSKVGVQTGDGVLALLQLQLEGKRIMTAEEFLRGQRDFLGALLPS